MKYARISILNTNKHSPLKNNRATFFIFAALFSVFVFLLYDNLRPEEDPTLFWTKEGTVSDLGQMPVLGSMRVDATARTAFLFDYAAPYKADGYDPFSVTTSERLSRRRTRLARVEIGGDTKFLLDVPGQKGFWWTNRRVDKIRIVAAWGDFRKKPVSFTTSLWTSNDGGNTMEESNLKLEGMPNGLFFDTSGLIGYLPIEQSVLWRTLDGGLTWKRLVLPLGDGGETLFGRHLIDSAVVDAEGTLWLTTMDRRGRTPKSLLYAIKPTDGRDELARLDPVATLLGERVFRLDIAPEGGLYLITFSCLTGECSMPNVKRLKEKALAHFHFFENGAFTRQHTFTQFYEWIDDAFVGPDGMYYVFLFDGDDRRCLYATEDGGRTWIERYDDPDILICSAIDSAFQAEWQYRGDFELYSRPIK